MARVLFGVSLLFGLLFSPALGSFWSWCNDHQQLKPTSASITPDPPHIGQAIHVNLQGDLAVDVTAGQVYVDVVVDHVFHVKKQLDFCKEYRQCPVNRGPVAITLDKDIPSSTPSGSIKGSAKIMNQDNAEVACVQVNFSLKKGGAPDHPTVNNHEEAERVVDALFRNVKLGGVKKNLLVQQ